MQLDKEETKTKLKHAEKLRKDYTKNLKTNTSGAERSQKSDKQ